MSDTQPTRDLQQGDPVSFPPFFLSGNGLSSLLQEAERVGSFKRIKVVSSRPSVSHLFFSDNSLVIYDACVINSCELKRILNVYELTIISKKVNFDSMQFLLA